MTPINLLTKSNSIRGMSDRPSAYRMTKLALPRFAPRTVGLRVEMEPTQPPLLVPLKMVEPKVEEPPVMKAVKVEEIQVLDVQPAPEEALAPAVVVPEPVLVKERKPWLPKFNFSKLMEKFALPKRAPKVVRFVREEEVIPDPVALVTAPPAPPAPPSAAAEKAKAGMWDLLLRRITFRRRVVKVRGVQTELALDRVAPIRNDLSDADLEVIPRMDMKKRGPNPFRTGNKAGRVKQAKEEKDAAPAMVPFGTLAAKPTE